MNFKEYLKEASIPSFESGDKVKIIGGNHKGKTGTIVDQAPAKDMYVVKIGREEDYVDAQDMKLKA